MNDLDRAYTQLLAGERDNRGSKALSPLHDRVRHLVAEGMKPTIKPTCWSCGTEVAQFGMKCQACVRE